MRGEAAAKGKGKKNREKTEKTEVKEEAKSAEIFLEKLEPGLSGRPCSEAIFFFVLPSLASVLDL